MFTSVKAWLSLVKVCESIRWSISLVERGSGRIVSCDRLLSDILVDPFVATREICRWYRGFMNNHGRSGRETAPNSDVCEISFFLFLVLQSLNVREFMIVP